MVVNKVTRSGSDLILHMSDGARIYAYRTTGSLWYPATNIDPGPGPDPDPDDPKTFEMVSNDGALTFTIQEQGMAYARIIFDAGANLGLGRDAITAAFMCVMVEAPPFLMYANSGIPESLNYPHDAVGSDHDSLGLFQQRPAAGWGTVAELMDADYNARAFYGGPSGPNGGSPAGLLDISPPWDERATLGAAVQAVQVSAHPERYDNWTTACYALYDALAGSTPSGDWAWPFRAWPSDEGGDMPPNGSSDQPLAEFGPRSGIGVGSFHEGMDAGYGSMLAGADVKCAGPGTVAFAAASGAFGNLVKVDHPDGTSTNYAHLASFSVSVGNTVEAGTLLGTVGGTGGVAPHLHFETHESAAADQVPNTNNDGGFRTAINPRDYMAARGA